MKKYLLSAFAVLTLLGAFAFAFVATSHGAAHAAPALSKAVVLAQAKSHHHQSNNLSVSPRTVVETTDGEVSFVVSGKNLIPHQIYTVDSPTFSNACSYYVSGLPTLVYTDFEGRFNTTVQAYDCIANSYEVYVQDDNTPFSVYEATLTIKTP